MPVRHMGYGCFYPYNPFPPPSIRTDNFHVLTHPIRRQIYPTGFSAGFDRFLDHFLTENSKLGLARVAVGSRFGGEGGAVGCFLQGDHHTPNWNGLNRL